MASTVIYVSLLLFLLLGSLALQTIAIKWGLKWAKIAEITWWKGLLYLLLFFVVTLVVAVAIFAPIAALNVDPSGPVLEILTTSIQIIIPILLIVKIWHASIWRAIQSLIPVVVATGVMPLFAIFVIRPFAYEAFVAPTNSMAPTILGNHSTGICPRCGASAYGFVPDGRRIPRPADGLVMMCSKELQSCKVMNISKSVGQPDRFLVSKLHSPRRWDAIVFRLPSDPQVNYVKRLIGLPGDELLIRDGAVWIDGKKLDVPDSLQGIEYLSSIEWNGVDHFGAGSTPVKLGPDEYFVLGDFSAQAADSRFWETGAPGHPPYAVPRDNVIGVVTHIYWPIGRWRILR